MGAVISCVESGPTHSLYQAVKQGRVSQLDLRLDHNPHMLLHHNLTDKDTLWHKAASAGNLDVLRRLFKSASECDGLALPGKPVGPEARMRVFVNLRNSKGQTPLMFAAYANKPQAVELLLEEGADPWAFDRCGKRSAIHYAVLGDSPACIAALLNFMDYSDAERYIGKQTISGFTPLHYAAATGKAAAAKALLQYGADITAGSTMSDAYDLICIVRWSTPLHVAAYMGDLPMALVLLQHYYERQDSGRLTDPRRRHDADGKTPYHVAIAKRHFEFAQAAHVSTSLEHTFSDCSPEFFGVPKLSIIAGHVVRNQLLLSLEKAEMRIMDRSNTFCGNTPTASSTSVSVRSRPVLDASLAPAFVRNSAGYESVFAAQPVEAVAQCAICLDDVVTVVTQKCHHRYCSSCARDFTKKASTMPLLCPCCRAVVVTFTSPV